MPRTIQELFRDSVESIKLNILVFGPGVTPISADENMRNLQLKRAQIRSELELLGHNAKYAEELVDPSLGNMMLQEELLMREYDLIINLVGSPGSNIEAGFIARSREIALKTQLFIDSRHTAGLVAEGCRLARDRGAHLKEYIYPADLVDCNLLGFVLERVSATQQLKYLD